MPELEALQCPLCTTYLKPSELHKGILRCAHCGHEFRIASDPEALHFIRQGEHDLDRADFAAAYEAYSKAAEADPDEPEAYFGMALAEFNVRYLRAIVKEDGKEKPILQPVCYKISDKKFEENKNAKKAFELAAKEDCLLYVNRAEEIDYINREFFELKKSGLDYDCFICVKVTETDDAERRTVDSGYADKIYSELKDEGYKPFYSERELSSRSGRDYEAMILYALYASECMLVVCGNEEYLQTKWVKNEYSRFLKLMGDEEKESDSIAIAYIDKPIKKLPGKRGGACQGIYLKDMSAKENIVDFVERHTPRAKLRREEEKRRKAEEEEARRLFLEELKRKSETPKAVKFCAECGTENPANVKFCGECGSREFVASIKEFGEYQRKKVLAEVERKEKEEQDRKLKEEAERKAQEERKAKEAEQKRLAEKAREEEQRKREAEQRAAEKAREEEQRKREAEQARIERERKAKESVRFFGSQTAPTCPACGAQLNINNANEKGFITCDFCGYEYELPRETTQRAAEKATENSSSADSVISQIEKIYNDGASLATMKEAALLLQKERAKPENKIGERNRRLNEALSLLLKAMSRPKNEPIKAAEQVRGEKVTYSNGDVYEGEQKDGKCNGYGKYTFANGTVYEGSFKDSKFDGYGKCVYNNGSVYEGEFKNGNYHGHGKMIYSDGDVYDGNWIGGTFNGHGKWRYANGTVYEGEFKNGKFDGHGKCVYNNGAVYEGEFKNGNYDGYGKMIYSDGAIYEGNWKDGKYDRRGKMIYSGGTIYEGEYKEDKRDGYGKYIYNSGTVYEGNWKAGKYDGHGRIRYSNGDFYDGEFKDDKRNGRGKYTYANGTVRDGEWKDGKFIG